MSSNLLRRLQALEALAGSRLHIQAAELVDGLLRVTVDGRMYKQTEGETESEFTSRLSTARTVVCSPSDVLL